MAPTQHDTAACDATLLDPGPGVVTDHPIFIISGAESRTIFQSDSLPSVMKRPLWSLSDFDVKSQLYRSATSLVVLATDQRTGIDVALKLYLKAKLVTLTKYQVEREIRIHSRLRHPELISMYAAFENKKYVVLVLEYCSGGDLHAQLDKVDRELSEGEACAIVQRLVSALVYLHSQNIIHRDIKPENCLLSADGTSIKLADFGLSIDCSQERPVTRGGTLDYMAPEVLLCHNKARPQDYKDKTQLVYDSKVDAWAVGVLTFELLVGRPPFEHECRRQTVDSIMYQRLEFPPGLSAQAKDFISGLLRKGAKQRCALSDVLDHPWLKAHAPPPQLTPAPAPKLQAEYHSPSPSRSPADADAPRGALGDCDLRIIIQPSDPGHRSQTAAQQPWSPGCSTPLPPPPHHPLLASHARSSAPNLTALLNPDDPDRYRSMNIIPLSGPIPTPSHRAAASSSGPRLRAGSLPVANQAGAVHIRVAPLAAVRQRSLGSSLSAEELELERSSGHEGTSLSQSWARPSHLQRIVENRTLSISAEAGAGAAASLQLGHGAAAASRASAPSVASRVSYLLSAMSPAVAVIPARTSPRSAGARPAAAAAAAAVAAARDKAIEQHMVRARNTWDAARAAAAAARPSERSLNSRPSRSNSLGSKAKDATRKPSPAAAAAAAPAADAVERPRSPTPPVEVAAPAPRNAAAAAVAPQPCANSSGEALRSDTETQRAGSPGGGEAAGAPMRLHVKRSAQEPAPLKDGQQQQQQQQQQATVVVAVAEQCSRPASSSCREQRRLLPRLFCFGGPMTTEC